MSNSHDALFRFEGHQVRTVLVLGVVWFVAADVCRVLSITNVGNALARLDSDERRDIHTADVTGRQQPMAIVSEPGVYRLIFSSRKPEAERFKRWLAHEVLPMIRRYGYYAPRGKSMSQSRMLIEARALFAEATDRRKADTDDTSERALCTEIGERIVAEHPEWLMPIAIKAAHDWLYHVWAREAAKTERHPDPHQGELWSHYSVMRDGRERWIPRSWLSRDETTAIIRKGGLARAAWRKLIDRLFKHDRALVADFNSAHLSEPLTGTEVEALAPDLAAPSQEAAWCTRDGAPERQPNAAGQAGETMH
jgi:prophage antirepressor-like protein